jgi:hypothetical protein
MAACLTNALGHLPCDVLALCPFCIMAYYLLGLALHRRIKFAEAHRLAGGQCSSGNA